MNDGFSDNEANTYLTNAGAPQDKFSDILYWTRHIPLELAELCCS
jgi:hypothetical protein